MIEFKPRPYQVKALNKIYADLQTMPEVLLVAIMGAGKTACSVTLIKRLYHENPGMTFLVLAHKKELVKQFKKAFLNFTDIPEENIGICCSGLNSKDVSKQVTIGTIQTYVNIMENHIGAGLCVIDESHRVDINGDTQYKQAFDYLRLQRPSCRILGITATPYRMGMGFCFGDKVKEGAKNMFPQMNHRITYEELRTSGYLVPLKGVIASNDSMEKDLAGISVQGEYNLTELGEIVCREIHLHTVLEAIEEHCQPYKCICVFCVDINHVEKLMDLMGDDATCVHSRLSDADREQNMADWSEGRKRIMISVNILIEGFDLPRLDCLVMARPTMSAALFLQAIGRVLRLCDGKDHGFIVDITGNSNHFGTDLDNVKIQVPKSVEKQIKKENDMFKFCPSCDEKVHKALRECPGCAFQWPENECVIAEALPEMKEVSFEKQPPVWYKIDSSEVMEHISKKNDKRLGKMSVSYKKGQYDFVTVNMFFCFADHYSGYAVEESRKKFNAICASGSTFPLSVDEFLSDDCELLVPSRVLIDESGKYPQIEEFEVVPF